MLQEQSKIMLSTLTKDKRAFKRFYRKGYFSYSGDENCKGKVAIVNKAIISFLEDANDESRVVATVNFKDSGTFIYKLFGQDYSFSRFGQDPTILANTARVYIRKKDDIIHDIGTIRKHCREAEKKASSIVAKFSTTSAHSDNKISAQDAFLLLQDTIDKLNKSRSLNEVGQTADMGR